VSNYGIRGLARTPKLAKAAARQRQVVPRRQANPRPGLLPNGKTPGGPKGLPPGLGGAARGGGQGATRAPGGPERMEVVASLKQRFGKKGKGAPKD
jgi:hypothetical protein